MDKKSKVRSIQRHYPKAEVLIDLHHGVQDINLACHYHITGLQTTYNRNNSVKAIKIYRKIR